MAGSFVLGDCGDHRFAPTFQRSRLAGTLHRPCLNTGCRVITLDDPDDDDHEETE